LKGLLSIIIPTLNEQSCIAATLQTLHPLRQQGHEIIVVDGGSQDNTYSLAQQGADKVLHCHPAGRALQMNAGVRAARGQLLLFLHADTQLPPQADQLIFAALTQGQWGRFNVRLSGSAILLRLVERLMNWRSCFSGIATGDQAMFMQRSVYLQVQGFPEIPLMEDVAMSRHLRQISPPVCLRAQVITSSRRWEQGGIIRTIFLMWCLRCAYALGVKPHWLKKCYD